MSSLIHDILKDAGRNKKRQRIGRGEGSKGKTSGRGQKGAGARGGKRQRLGFEGGQTEIYRRFPQRGFSNAMFKTAYHPVNVEMLNRFEEGQVIDRDVLKTAGLIPNRRLGVKILGDGELSKKLVLRVDAYSRSAYQAIVDAGGEATTAKGEPYEFKAPKNERLRKKLDKRLNGLGIATDEPGDADTAAPAETAGDVTSAPEAGTGTTTEAAAPAPKPGGTASDGDGVGDAPESGTQG